MYILFIGIILLYCTQFIMQVVNLFFFLYDIVNTVVNLKTINKILSPNRNFS